MWRQHATILDIIACCVAVPDMCHQRPIEWTCGSWRVFDFLPMLPTLTKASFQGFGSCLSVDILFWCWDPTLAHSASCDHFALTTTHPPCSASSLLPLPTNASILIYVSHLHCLLLFTLLKCDFIGLNRFYEPLLSLSYQIDTYPIITIYVPYCFPLLFLLLSPPHTL